MKMFTHVTQDMPKIFTQRYVTQVY